MNDRRWLLFFLRISARILYILGILQLLMRRKLPAGLYVFNYHNFNEFCNDPWRFGNLFRSNYSRSFRKQLIFYKRFFHRVENPELLNNDYNSPVFLLTFDDGYRDNFRIARPLMKTFEVPAIFFITTSVIGTQRRLWFDKIRQKYFNEFKNRRRRGVQIKRDCKQNLRELKRGGYRDYIGSGNIKSEKAKTGEPLMMTWNEVRMLRQDGFFIGAHGKDHYILSELDLNESTAEISDSIEAIHQHLGYRTPFFAYPDGAYNDQTLFTLERIEVRYAFTTDNGINRNMERPYLIKRIGVNPSDSVPILALKILRAMKAERESI